MLMRHYADMVRERGAEPKEGKVVFERCRSVVEWMIQAERRGRPGSRGLMLSGGCGNGKSTMCEAIRRFYQQMPKPLSCIMITASELNRVCSEKTADDGRFENWCRCLRLIIDDLGTQQPYVMDYGNQRFPFNELLEERYNRNLITIISTNITRPEEFRRLYGARIEDRVREYFWVVPVTENSYR